MRLLNLKSFLVSTFIGIMFLILAVSGKSNPHPGETLTVHVVTHSHLDAGWIFDIDECFKTAHKIFATVF